MLQRIERHFRNEQAIRRRAEEAEAAAAEELAHERDQRLRMEEELRTRSAEAQHTDALKANLQAEYLAVEQDKERVEQQLQEARNEVCDPHGVDVYPQLRDLACASPISQRRRSGRCLCLQRRRRVCARRRAWSA